MNKPSFEQIMWTLSSDIPNTAQCLRAARAIEDLYSNYIPDKIVSPDGKAEFNGVNWTFSHDSLVTTALSNASVMQEVAYGRKIGAIKSLRFFTGCGLKAAKDAIEDNRVWQMDPELADHMRNYSTNFAEDN